jgi:hypothetical protein
MATLVFYVTVEWQAAPRVRIPFARASWICDVAALVGGDLGGSGIA